jgi:hypothetical protein
VLYAISGGSINASEQLTVRSSIYLALGACFVLCGVILDGVYQRSTPDPVHTQGTVVDFERPHPKQVYPVFEFTDATGKPHRVTSSAQQGIVRLAPGDSVPIAYSRADPQKARIDTLWFSHRWTMGAVFVALSMGLAALGRRGSSSSPG